MQGEIAFINFFIFIFKKYFKIVLIADFFPIFLHADLKPK